MGLSVGVRTDVGLRGDAILSLAALNELLAQDRPELSREGASRHARLARHERKSGGG
jgi:hypothetical protein